MPVFRGAARMAMSLMRRMSSTTSTLQEGTQGKFKHEDVTARAHASCFLC